MFSSEKGEQMKVRKVVVKTTTGQYEAQLVNDEPDELGRIRILFDDTKPRAVAAVLLLEPNYE